MTRVINEAGNHEEEPLNLLAQETERVLRDRGWSLRRAERQTRVNYATINNMKQGRSVGMEFIIQWARAINEDLNYWLRIAGKPEIAPPDEGAPRTVQPGDKIPLRAGDVVEFLGVDGEPREAVLTPEILERLDRYTEEGGTNVK